MPCIAPETMVQRLTHLLCGLEVGGAERVVLDLAQRARAEGLDHRLLLFDSPFRDRVRDYDPGDVPVTFLQRGPGLDVRFAWRLSRFLARERPDVLHAHEDTALFYGALACALLPPPRPRLVATFHAWPSHPTPGARRATRWATRRAEELVAVSPELGERLVGAGWAPRVRTIWNGIDLDLFQPDGSGGGWRARLGVPEDALLVGHVGRMVPVKRQADLLAVAQRLADHVPHLAFVLAGSGPDHATIAAEADELANVHVVARVDDVAAFLRELDLLVLCSAHEGAPRIVLEGLACGCPLVATRVGGVPEMVGSAARLVTAERPDELTEAVASLAGDARARSELSAAGLLQVRRFSLDDTFADYRALWAGVPTSRPRVHTTTTPGRDPAARQPQTPPIRNGTP